MFGQALTRRQQLEANPDVHARVEKDQPGQATLQEGMNGITGPEQRRWTVWRALRLLLMVVLPVLIMAGGFAFFSYMRATKPKVLTERPQERALLVETVTATRGSATPSLLLYGQITAGRSIDIRALVAGEVMSVSPGLVEGGMLTLGETILQIDPFAFEGAVVRANADLAETRGRMAEIDARVAQERAALLRAEEQLAIAGRDNARLRQLAGSGATTQRALDDSSLRLSQSQAALELRQNQMAIYRAQARQLDAAQARQAFALRQAERNLADVALKAPFAAIVSNAAADTGKMLNVNDRVATLVAINALEVRFSLSASQYARLTSDGQSLEGRRATLAWGQGQNATAAPSGHAVTVTRVAAQASGGSYDVFASFNGAVPAALRPGSFVEVVMTDRSFADVLALPPSAVQDGYVFIINDNRLKRIAVETVLLAPDQALVRGPIPDGAVVVTTAMVAPVDGQLVAVRAQPLQRPAGAAPAKAMP